MDKKLKVWLKAHDACESGIKRLRALHIMNMQDAYNKACPEDLIWAITREGVLTQWQCVQFALFCMQQIKNELTDERSKAVIPALEGWLNGTVSQKKMKKISRAAADAAADVAAADAAADAAAYAAADAADAAAAAADADDAAYAAAHAAVYAAADDDAKNKAEWIRNNIPFKSLNLE